MARSKRQRHEELVFHQIEQIELSAANQHVLFEFLVQASGGGLVMRETEGAVHGYRLFHRLQATLA